MLVIRLLAYPSTSPRIRGMNIVPVEAMFRVANTRFLESVEENPSRNLGRFHNPRVRAQML